MREDAVEGSRKNVGRRPNPTAVKSLLTENKQPTESAPAESTTNQNHETSTSVNRHPAQEPAERGKIRNSNSSAPAAEYETLSGNKPHPNYIAKGPIITRDMFNKWTPDLLGLPNVSTRPTHSTRNPNPCYIDVINAA